MDRGDFYGQHRISLTRRVSMDNRDFQGEKGFLWRPWLLQQASPK